MADDLKADLVKCLANSDVIVAGDEAWPDAIKRWTNYRAQVPAAVVQPTGEQDVIAAVSYAIRNQRPFVVRGGGHSNGFSTVKCPGIVIDLRLMRKVTVDAEKQVLIAEGGATMGDGVRAASSVGMAIATGTCNEVGLVGAALGGGIGRFIGHLGYAADTLISCRVVIVDKCGVTRAVEASQQLNPDLFWGLRGGGHMFGVVVEATFRAVPWAYDTWHSCLVFAPDYAGVVAEAVEKVHCEGGMQGRLVFCAPNRQAILLLQLWYLGPPDDAARRFEHLLNLPSLVNHPLNFVGRRVPYPNLNDSSDRICSYIGRKNLTAFGMKKLSAESCLAALKVFMDFIGEHTDAAQTHILTEFYSMDVVNMIDRQGQETSVPSEIRQEVKYWVMPLAWYEDPALDGACAELSRAIEEAFLTQADGTRAPKVGYVNMASEHDTVRSVFGNGERLEKLRELKRKWDPLGVVQGIVSVNCKV